jgi:hypothetical protein
MPKSCPRFMNILKTSITRDILYKVNSLSMRRKFPDLRIKQH